MAYSSYSKAPSTGRWITIRGTHIFIRDGQTVTDAIKDKFGVTQKTQRMTAERFEDFGLGEIIRSERFDAKQIEANYRYATGKSMPKNRKDRNRSMLVDTIKSGHTRYAITRPDEGWSITSSAKNGGGRISEKLSKRNRRTKTTDSYSLDDMFALTRKK